MHIFESVDSTIGSEALIQEFISGQDTLPADEHAILARLILRLGLRREVVERCPKLKPKLRMKYAAFPETDKTMEIMFCKLMGCEWSNGFPDDVLDHKRKRVVNVKSHKFSLENRKSLSINFGIHNKDADNFVREYKDYSQWISVVVRDPDSFIAAIVDIPVSDQFSDLFKKKNGISKTVSTSIAIKDWCTIPGVEVSYWNPKYAALLPRNVAHVFNGKVVPFLWLGLEEIGKEVAKYPTWMVGVPQIGKRSVRAGFTIPNSGRAGEVVEIHSVPDKKIFRLPMVDALAASYKCGRSKTYPTMRLNLQANLEDGKLDTTSNYIRVLHLAEVVEA